jgi:hypothetical protein
MDRAERKRWFRFLDQATDVELSRAQVSLNYDLDKAAHPDVNWDTRWKLRTLREELAARAEVARWRRMYCAG